MAHWKGRKRLDSRKSSGKRKIKNKGRRGNETWGRTEVKADHNDGPGLREHRWLLGVGIRRRNLECFLKPLLDF
jgi:hypothetical protein